MANIKTLSKKIENKAKTAPYPPSAIAHKINSNIPLAHKNETIEEIRSRLLENIANYNSINYVYVISKRKILHGVFSIKDLFKVDPETKAGKIMKKDLTKAHLKTNQEKVAHMAVKHSIKAVPVVDDKGKLLGVVTSDSILSILDSEYRKDFLRMTGIVGKIHYDETSSLPLHTAFIRRVPWIMIGLIGGTVTASTISGFHHVLQKNIVLASFIPLIAYIANAVANQTQTLFIRDLAIASDISFKKYAVKQAAISFLIAISCWLLIFIITSIVWNSPFLGFVVGLAMSAAILTATVLGLIIPQIMEKFDLDPAVGSGPFATVIQDFLSVTIYFTTASIFL
jgi:magnesium transporter